MFNNRHAVEVLRDLLVEAMQGCSNVITLDELNRQDDQKPEPMSARISLTIKG